MPTTVEHDAIDYLLGAAYIDLGQARIAQRDKDTPAHREAVAAARRRIDHLLDVYNLTR